ncbi:divergent polysaccharide deacetylase family protein [Mesorhizobium xinjiangense]|uniref:divergent polysaccharide deacetylase family protein n=1 Tax=Mesorhizobium xinjiangense TaxID=2678685 RepID=UPI0012EDAD1B|nr:divergent polysaccharide deacetylase family protein [Mesorhizobium xinjiangense]
MPIVDKEIERPLGANVKTGPRRRRGAPRILALTVVVAALAGAGLFAVFDKDALRTPRPATDATVSVEPAEAEPGTTPSEIEARSDSPSVISVEPDGAAQNVIVIRDPSALGQDQRVAHLPDRALIEQSEMGPLPVRAADGRRPFDVYARPWSGSGGTKIALVIGGLGLSQTGTQTAIRKLPPEVTLAFAPQGNSLDRWMREARRAGHEIVMQLPLEPFDYPHVNPGRNTLTIAGSDEQNLGNLRWVLSRTTNYTGVMNYMGARFSADEAKFAPVMAEIGERGLLYLDDGASARSLAPDLARANKTPFAVATTTIDGERDRASILKKLDEVEATARAKGSALATGSAFETTVDAVTNWVAEAKRRGIEIVSVSALAADPEKK